MDGDRTFAILKDIKETEINDYAYYTGAIALEELMKTVFNKQKIKCLTVNLVGRKNCKDRPESIKIIVKLVPRFFGDKWIQYFIDNKIHVKFIGDLDLFCNLSEEPEKIKNDIDKVEHLTANFNDFYLNLMTAYESNYEYVNLLKNNTDKTIDELKTIYYGYNAPDVNIFIRTWRPKLSGGLPIFIGDYADIYFFTSPFQYFRMRHLKKILEDYSKRKESTRVDYTEDDIKTIRSLSKNIEKGKVLVIGDKISNIWFPFKNSSLEDKNDDN